jgi:hypothetical protein
MHLFVYVPLCFIQNFTFTVWFSFGSLISLRVHVIQRNLSPVHIGGLSVYPIVSRISTILLVAKVFASTVSLYKHCTPFCPTPWMNPYLSTFVLPSWKKHCHSHMVLFVPLSWRLSLCTASKSTKTIAMKHHQC